MRISAHRSGTAFAQRISGADGKTGHKDKNLALREPKIPNRVLAPRPTFVACCRLVLKQDPRYFYKGSGSTRSRLLYAISNAVICKGDNNQWQPNYSSFVGILATGALSYVYYPESDRNGAGLFFQSAVLRLVGLVRKLTPQSQP
jgi:hypothetical protein